MLFTYTFVALATVSTSVLAVPTEHSKRQFNYINSALAAHNVHRSNHSAGDLQWDNNLANDAQDWASHCTFSHDTSAGGGGYGQNIAVGYSDTSISVAISDQWYNGEVNNFDGLYGQAQPDFNGHGETGHFTQVVWKGTTSVGCATQYCNGGVTGFQASPWITVCNYLAQGNYYGDYADNVGEPLGQPTVTGADGL